MLHQLYARKDGYADQDLLPYNPSEPAAYAFTALFAIAGFTHLVLMFPYRAWFPIPMIIGTAMEAGSYYLRSQSHDNVRQLLPFILSTLLIMGAAPMLAATIYMSLKRVVNALDAADHALISTRWSSKLFVLFDVACFVSQIAGSTMRADAETAQKGTTLVMTGLITQVVIFFIYIALAASVHLRLNRNPTSLSEHPALSWRKVLWNLYVVSGLFLIRNFIRIMEFKQGDHGWLLSNEAPIYIFDGGFMWVIVVMMALVHPGKLARKAERMGKEGGMELNWRDSAREPFRPLESQV
ncbi:RTA1 domain-containing protein (RTM1) [Stagonosporopsis vannaccii]|nr:RTA1 domain-containing protein (RTM1) [Stagonosporopsis vannaccii]